MNKKKEKKEELTLNDKIKFDSKDGAILGILEGPVADFKHPTRNGRNYDESLWDTKLFDDPDVKELIKNGGIPGELDHPTDREDICSEKIAVLMKELPEKDESGLLIGKFNIVDTPCGRIVYSLAKAGFKFGVSSRGTGETYYDDEGNERVDENSYKFKCFDLVILPAVEEARMRLVTEGLNTDKKINYKKELKEIYDKSSSKDKKIMLETLSHLNLNISLDAQHKQEEVNVEPSDNSTQIKEEKIITQNEDTSNEQSNNSTNADDVRLNEILESLQNTLKANATLKASVFELHEKLAVSDAKVDELNEELTKYKNATMTLSTKAKELKKQKNEVSTLEESNRKLKSIIKKQRAKLVELLESKYSKKTENTLVLSESLKTKDETIEKLNSDVTTLNEELSNKESKINELTDELKAVRDEATTSNKELKESLNKSTILVNKYKSLANKTISQYIDFRAKILGVSPNEIKNKLDESYSLKDVDEICEGIQSYTLNVSKLPFNVDRKVNVRVSNSQKDTLANIAVNDDDSIDESLLKIAKL